MSDYYRPQEILVLEAEVARSKAYLERLGVPSELVEANVALLTELVIGARRAPAGLDDVSLVAAKQFRRMMLGCEASNLVERAVAVGAAPSDLACTDLACTDLATVRRPGPEIGA